MRFVAAIFGCCFILSTGRTVQDMFCDFDQLLKLSTMQRDLACDVLLLREEAQIAAMHLRL